MGGMAAWINCVNVCGCYVLCSFVGKFVPNRTSNHERRVVKVDLLINKIAYSKNNLFEIVKLTYSGFSKGTNQNKNVDKYRTQSESLWNVTALEEPNAA